MGLLLQAGLCGARIVKGFRPAMPSLSGIRVMIHSRTVLQEVLTIF
jgi:hypothetical protein